MQEGAACRGGLRADVRIPLPQTPWRGVNGTPRSFEFHTLAQELRILHHVDRVKIFPPRRERSQLTPYGHTNK